MNKSNKRVSSKKSILRKSSKGPVKNLQNILTQKNFKASHKDWKPKESKTVEKSHFFQKKRGGTESRNVLSSCFGIIGRNSVQRRKIQLAFIFLYKKSFFQKRKNQNIKEILVKNSIRLNKIKKAFFLYIRRKKFKKLFQSSFSNQTRSQYLELVYEWKQKASLLGGFGIFPVKAAHFEFSYRLGEGILLFSPQKFYTLSLINPLKL